MNQPELARPARGNRARNVLHVAAALVTPASVTVAWTPNHDGVSSSPPIEVELVAEAESAPNRTWTCSEGFGSRWVDALASARCSEVLLTARLGDDLSAKHLVLELTQLLAFTLTESQPLIRVVFLPTTSGPRVARRHA